MPQPGKPVGSQLKNLLLASTLVGAGTAGVTAAIQGLRKVYHRMAEDHRYQNMLEVSPELKRYPQSRLIFRTFNNIAPHLAADPLVASTFVRQTLATDMGGGPAIDPLTAHKLHGQAKNVSVSSLTPETVSKTLSRLVGPFGSGDHGQQP